MKKKIDRKAMAQRQRDWESFCDHCGVAQTSADREAGECTNCHRVTTRPDIMFQRIEMPGYPGIVVTRLFLYDFLKDCGWPVLPTPGHRFDTVDFRVFGPHRTIVDRPLTDEKLRDRLLRRVRKGWVREPLAA